MRNNKKNQKKEVTKFEYFLDFEHEPDLKRFPPCCFHCIHSSFRTDVISEIEDVNRKTIICALKFKIFNKSDICSHFSYRYRLMQEKYDQHQQKRKENEGQQLELF